MKRHGLNPRPSGRRARQRYLHSARAELLRRLGRAAEAREEYRQAAALSDDAAERRLFERRLEKI